MISTQDKKNWYLLYNYVCNIDFFYSWNIDNSNIDILKWFYINILFWYWIVF